jgi:hypothetical protein
MVPRVVSLRSLLDEADYHVAEMVSRTFFLKGVNPDLP